MVNSSTLVQADTCRARPMMEERKLHNHQISYKNSTVQHKIYDALRRLILPTVHAQTAENAELISETTDTIIERLEKARPQVIISEKDVKDYIDQESGMQRIREMFSKGNNGEYSDDARLIVNMSSNCALAVFLVTSVLGGNAARQKFIEKNKHKVYETRFQALRAYNDAVVFGSFRLGIKWGFKSAIFAGLFMTTAQAISVYRNKSSLVEYAAAGSVTCGLLRMSVGLRGMFAGAVIGAAMGLVGGAVMCASMYATDSTQQHRRYGTIERMLREQREAQQLNPQSLQSLNS